MEVIFEIRVDKASIKAIEKSLGYSVARNQEKRAIKAANKLAQEALRALQSKVPVDTGELRNNFLAIDYAKGSSPARVGIDQGTHYGRDNQPMSAIQLALDWLNTGKAGNRSQDSHNISPYSSIEEGTSTKGWITSAKQAFNNRRRAILNG